MTELAQFIIDSSESLLSAMKKIDANKKGFLIILNNEKVVGTITDGDIRRAVISGENINCTLSRVCNTDFKYILIDDNFTTIIERFKDEKVKFIPIVDSEMHLRNIITKANLHVLLLQDIPYNCNYPFLNLDDTMLEHEIFPRPWGYYKTAFINQYCQCKLIHVNPKSMLSLQKHMHRDEHWIVVHGNGRTCIGDDVIEIKAGDSFVIPRGVLHRLINVSESESLIVTEVQLGDYFGEDDIIRVKDEYGRCK